MSYTYIGNYIHYHASNYLRYGTTMSQKSAGKAVDIENILNSKHIWLETRLQAQKDDIFKEKYQNLINYLFGGSNLASQNLNDKTLIEQEFKDYLEKEFPDIILNSATSNKMQKINIENRLQSRKKTHISFNYLQKQIQELTNEFKRQKIKNKYREKELQQYEKILNKVTKIEKELYASAQESLKNGRAFIQMSNGKLGMDLTKINLKQRSFLNDLNMLIDLYNTLFKVDTYQTLGAISAEYAGNHLKGAGIEQTEKFFKNSGLKADIVFSSAFVDLAKLAKTKKWTYTNKKGKIEANRGVDTIVFQLENEGKQEMNIFKNVQIQKLSDVSLMTTVPFLTLIENENQDDFINHYFNITADHPSDRDENHSTFSSMRERMHGLMRQIIFLNALEEVGIGSASLEGAKESRGTKKYFIIQDNKNPYQKFKIFSASELLKFSGQSQSSFSRIAQISGYNNPVWENDWVDSGPQERITNIMLQAHQLKIRAGVAMK